MLKVSILKLKVSYRKQSNVYWIKGEDTLDFDEPKHIPDYNAPISMHGAD